MTCYPFRFQKMFGFPDRPNMSNLWSLHGVRRRPFVDLGWPWCSLQLTLSSCSFRVSLRLARCSREIIPIMSMKNIHNGVTTDCDRLVIVIKWCIFANTAIVFQNYVSKSLNSHIAMCVISPDGCTFIPKIYMWWMISSSIMYTATHCRISWNIQMQQYVVSLFLK